ncbi:hypothetical protein JI752_019065 [Lysobacter sp. MMG2]|uniref:hypothetical protein n=1 Tax=Lysobacter sp. MMG2 TaxID=2801338 RepID=UPI001C21A083|nr:hypothetical protein [Lysobacter sp. MMG2]MBU8978253.1 hypothetical protein [Lysobacter sp. MMG2]
MEALTQRAAVALAEQFVAESGYTGLPPEQITKTPLYLEPFEPSGTRRQVLQQRHNTLQPKAIGARVGRRGGQTGWSVAFAYTSSSLGKGDSCRVVTMDEDGANMRIERDQGDRSYFAGFY